MSHDGDGGAQELLRREESFSRSRRGAVAAQRARQGSLNLFGSDNAYCYMSKRHKASPPMAYTTTTAATASTQQQQQQQQCIEATSPPPAQRLDNEQQQQQEQHRDEVVTLSLSPPPRNSAHQDDDDKDNKKQNNNNEAECRPCRRQQQQQQSDEAAAVTPTRHRYLNAESSATREFAHRGMRHVTPPAHHDTPQGTRHTRRGGSCASVAGQQHIQVVNIPAHYADPSSLSVCTPRPLVRAQPAMRDSHDVRDALRYAGTLQQLTGRGVHSPVGKPRPELRHAADATRPVRFYRAVRDHAAQRARGITEFYVHLTRDLVGGATAVPIMTTTTTSNTASSTASNTPRAPSSALSSTRPSSRACSLRCGGGGGYAHYNGSSVITAPVTGPPRPTLTLQRCRDQLVALTSIPVTLSELACMLWGSVPAEVQDDDDNGDGRDEDAAKEEDEATAAAHDEEDKAADDSEDEAVAYSESEVQALLADVEYLDDEQLQALLHADAQAHPTLATTPVLFRHFAATFSR